MPTTGRRSGTKPTSPTHTAGCPGASSVWRRGCAGRSEGPTRRRRDSDDLTAPRNRDRERGCQSHTGRQRRRPGGGESQRSPLHCAGMNECKAKGACASAANAGKGHNTRKGEGWIETRTAEECVKRGGKVVEAKTT